MMHLAEKPIVMHPLSVHTVKCWMIEFIFIFVIINSARPLLVPLIVLFGPSDHRHLNDTISGEVFKP
jgi:hypothetical protein